MLFLQKLKDKFRDRRLVIFMDNLQVHKSSDVKKEYERLDIIPIYSIPYSPEYNGIESTFFTIKQVYKKE
jgi:transposase